MAAAAIFVIGAPRCWLPAVLANGDTDISSRPWISTKGHLFPQYSLQSGAFFYLCTIEKRVAIDPAQYPAFELPSRKDNCMADENLLTFVADIVSAHASHNSVKPAELPRLIEAIYAALAGLGKTAAVVVEKREPAVSIRSSVKPDAITCLECGARQKMLKRHLATHHQLTPAEYKLRWGLNAEYPLVAPDYAATRRDLAVKIGLGRKLGTKMKAAAKPAAGTGKKVAAARKSRVAKVAPA